MRVNVNLVAAPDQVIPVSPGEHDLMILGIPIVKPTNDKLSTKLVVDFVVTGDDDPDKDRRVFDHISLKMDTRLKHLCQSAGVTFDETGFDAEDLEDKIVKVIIQSRTYEDQDTGEMKETARIKDYIVPIS